MLKLTLATKANTKVVSEASKAKLSERFKNWPVLTYSHKTENFKLKPSFFEASGINTSAKSVSYAVDNGIVYFCTVEGNSGVSLKASKKGEKGNLFRSAELFSYLQEAGLIPAEITADYKAGFDLNLLTEEVEGVLEAYTVTSKEFPTKEDSEDAIGEEIGDVVENGVEEVSNETITDFESAETEDFGDDI